MSTKSKGIFDVSKEDKKMLDQIFCDVGPLFFANCGATTSVGFVNGIMPALKRYYLDKGDQEGFLDALNRHDVRYNITQNVGTICFGMVAAMEKQASEDPNFDKSAINSLKTSIQGPMSGIGDAIFWGVVRTIAASIALGMVGDGSILAPIMFIVLYQTPSLICKYAMTYIGFNLGSDFIVSAYESGVMAMVTKAVNTIGLIMVGAMTASTVSFSLALKMQVTSDAEPVMVQKYVDDIFVGILPLAITLGCMVLLNKGFDAVTLTLAVVAFGIVLSILGIA